MKKDDIKIGYYFPKDSEEFEKVNIIAAKDNAVFIEIPPRENALGILEKEHHIATVGKDFFQSAREAEKEAEKRNLRLRLNDLEKRVQALEDRKSKGLFGFWRGKND